MKILQVQLHAGQGGAESVALTLEAEWRKQGHDVATVALTDATSGVVASVEPPWAPVTRTRRARAHLRPRPDVIVAHATFAGLYMRLAAFSMGIRLPVIVVGHSATDDWEKSVVRLVERIVSWLSPAVWLVVNPEIGEQIRRYRFRTRGPIALIDNPVPKDFFKAGREPQSPPLILMLGRVVEQKDVLGALTVAALLRDAGCDFQLRIYGDDSDARYVDVVRRQLSDAKLEGFVTLHKGVADVPLIMSNASVLLHCAWREAASQVLREASAARLPIVATVESLAGVPEVQPLASFPAGDYEAAASALRRVVEGKSPLLGSQIDEGRFSATSVAESYLSAVDVAP